tara:strand:- start:77 stop:388 length:312 start_codon:yes stop_codon:yes gene_type:complete
MQFSDRPENQVGFEWGGQFAKALLDAGVKASTAKRKPSRPRIPRSKEVTRIEMTRISGADGSTKALRQHQVTIRLVHTDKTAEVERLKENGWVFPEKEIVEEV